MLSFIQARSTGLLGGIEWKNGHLVLTFRKHNTVLETYEREGERQREEYRERYMWEIIIVTESTCQGLGLIRGEVKISDTIKVETNCA